MEMSHQIHYSFQEMVAYVYIVRVYSLICKTHVYVQKYFILVVRISYVEY